MNRKSEGADDHAEADGTPVPPPPRPPADASHEAAARSGELGGLAMAGLGFQFAVALVVFYYLGQWLDRRLGTAPVFLLGCVFVGGGASFYAMYTQLMRAQRRADAARQAGSAGGTGSRRPDGR